MRRLRMRKKLCLTRKIPLTSKHPLHLHPHRPPNGSVFLMRLNDVWAVPGGVFPLGSVMEHNNNNGSGRGIRSMGTVGGRLIE